MRSKINNPPLMGFDYAIQYLLEDEDEYSVVESFISALLKTQGYKEAKIIALLEIDGNKAEPRSKRFLADLVVEDQDGHKYIVEIERNLLESNLENKACFNTSRLLRSVIARDHGSQSNRNDVLLRVVDKL